MITSLLIANRGEIACRIIRTARAMGIRTVAVYSDADARALHVRQADEAVHVGPSPARESYLVGEKIIVAAKAANAEAIHPGYGFLSENADFAQAVIDAGLIWVGPRPDSIRAMGLKDAAKQRMIAAGVPVTPGYLGEDQSEARLQAEADAIGYPVLIKAVAGGGGKGMRRVDEPDAFADALISCRREAASSFGDDRVLIEKYILSPRHIEVQVFGDTHGNIVHLFERDCSLQRRHQKVIEEAPAPGMDSATREAICAAAVKAAKAVDYVGAGTIEFIADTSDREDGGSGLRADRIWFMEMNTRLQVEHPVTEEITGVDLVEWQLRVASGEVLPLVQDELSINGCAIEARLYAEDPAKGFLPSTGRLDRLQLPDFFARIETSVEQGDNVSPYYDPMIAKLIVHEADRHQALANLARACKATVIWPVSSNADFLHRLCTVEDVTSGNLDTGVIDRRMSHLVQPPDIDYDDTKGAAISLLLEQVDSRRPYQLAEFTSRSRSDRSVPAWGDVLGFRLNAPKSLIVRLDRDGVALDVDLTDTDIGLEKVHHAHANTKNLGGLVLAGMGVETRSYKLLRSGGVAAGAAADGTILSPMPGRIIAVEIAAGQAVTKGQKLVTLEAMKMEHSLVAPFDGTVAELNAEPGAQVSEGTLLVRVEKADIA